MEKEFSPEVEVEKFIPQELHTQEELVQFWLTNWRNNGVVSKDSKRQLFSAMLEARRTFKQLSNESDPWHIFGVTNGDEMIATGRLSFSIDENKEKHGYLSGLTVDPAYRGKSIAKKITDARIEKAREQGCVHIDTEIYAKNPHALATKLHEGFLMIKPVLDEDELMGFFLSKRIDGQEKSDDTNLIPENQSVVMSDQVKLRELLGSGWVGVDVKNLGEVSDNDPEKWAIIFEKK